MSGSSKNWVFTLFPLEDELWLEDDSPVDLWNPETMKYIIYQLEKAPTTGKLHLQGCVQLKKKVRMQGVKKLFTPYTPHVEFMRGSIKEARDYCSKRETKLAGPWEFGEQITQGTRTDLAEVTKAIKEGASKAKISNDYPEAVVKFSRGLDYYRHSIECSPDWRQLTVTYLYGPPEVGKSRMAWDSEERRSLVYKVEGDGQWWDGYDHHRTILFDDMQSNIPIVKLLSYLDGYPLQVAVKGGFTWAFYTRVFITANIPLSEQYKKEHTGLTTTYQEDLLKPEIRAALERRITEILRKESRDGDWIKEK